MIKKQKLKGNVFYKSSQKEVTTEWSESDQDESESEQIESPSKAAKQFLLSVLEKVDYFVMSDICYDVTKLNKVRKEHKDKGLPSENIESDLIALNLSR